MKSFILSLILLVSNFFSPKNLSPQATIFPTLIPSPTPTPFVQISLEGDLGLGRHITSIARSKDDFSWSFSKISPWLLQNDFNLANLESPIITNCPEGKTGTFTFCGDDRFLPELKKNKFILNLNNNHILNYGIFGLNQTQSFLTSSNIPYFSSEFTIQTINNITFGFLGFDFITYPKTDKNKILNSVKQYNPQVDWLIVSPHWGNEYLPKPEKWRVDFAHDLVDAGADIIHGHHPHVWQGQEIYKNKPIFYSLGNFIFDQSWSYETSHSKIVRLTLTKDKILNTEITPIEIKYNSQPQIQNLSSKQGVSKLRPYSN